jgi:AcrR family transcriptional regulator
MSPRAGLDKQMLIQAAVDFVDEQGSEKLSLTSLARRLGVSKPALYNHIASLADLQYELVLYTKREVLAQVRRAATEKSGFEAMYALAEVFRAQAQTHPNRYALTLQFHRPDDTERQRIEQELLAVVSSVLTPFQMSKREVFNAILGIRSISEGFISLEMEGSIPSSEQDEYFHWIISVFVTGLLGIQRPRGADARE